MLQFTNLLEHFFNKFSEHTNKQRNFALEIINNIWPLNL